MTREEIIQAIKEMTVLELNELVTACEEEECVPIWNCTRWRLPRFTVT